MATKTKATKAVKKTTSTKTVKKRETTADLKKKIAELENRLNKTLEEHGNLLSATANITQKLDVMLGQMLKALFIVGIGPDELMAKCQQMFRKNVVAD
jgi:hypothetical protein